MNIVKQTMFVSIKRKKIKLTNLQIIKEKR